MADIAELSVLLRLRGAQQAQQQLSGFRRQLSGVATAAASAAKSFGIALATGAVIGGVTASIRIWGNFEQTMARVGAVSGATEQELAALAETARAQATTTMFTASQTAEALQFMAMAGMSVQESMGALPSVLELAAAGAIDVGQAADVVTNIMAGMRLGVDDLGRANDVLVTAFTSANTNLQQLGQAFKFAGPVASAAGLTFEETAAALALMGNAGIQASMAGTGLRGAITRLLSPSNEAADVMRRLGLNVVNAQGGIVPLVDVIRQLEQSGLTAADAMEIFGQRAGPAMLALVSEGSESLTELEAKMRSATGFAGTIGAAQLNTFSGQMAIAFSRLQEVALVFGEELAPAILSAADALASLLEALTPVASLISLVSNVAGAPARLGTFIAEQTPQVFGPSGGTNPTLFKTGPPQIKITIGNEEVRNFVVQTVRDTAAEGGFRGRR